MSTQDLIITKLQRNEHTEYCYGLVENIGVISEKDLIISVSKDTNRLWRKIEYDIKRKELRISEKEEDGVYSYVDLNESLSSVIDLNDDGMRWEGSCHNTTPFGYGQIHNSSNELIYQGVMIGDSKECFGIEFYPSRSQIEYIGCYWNNKRHGFGMLYDRKGELMYEGDWLFGDPLTTQGAIVNDRNMDSQYVHSMVEELIIDSKQLSSNKIAMNLNGWIHLKRIEIKSGSCQRFLSLTLQSSIIE